MKVLNEDFLLNNINFNTQVLKSQKTEPHSHSFYEIVYVIFGKAKHIINGKESVLNIGDFVVLCPDTDTHYFLEYEKEEFIHRDILIDRELFERTCNFLSPDLLNSLTSAEGNRRLSLNNNDLNFLETLFQTPKFLDTSNYEQNRPFYTACIAMIIGVISKIVCDNAPSNKNTAWVSQLINTLSTCVNFNKTIAEIIAEHFQYDQSYICKAFKKATGMTMTKFFTRSKLEYAKTLIVSTDLSINVIAEKTGFNNLSHFNHEFKKTYNHFPTYYRKNPVR